MYVPSTTVNGVKFYMASPITRKLGYGDTSTCLKRYVNPNNRVLLKATDFGVSGPTAWAVDINGLKTLIQFAKQNKETANILFQNIFEENKPRTLEQCIVEEPEVVIELCKKIQKIKEENNRILIMAKSISNLLNETDQLLNRSKSFA
jgi:hypothetical protein